MTNEKLDAFICANVQNQKTLNQEIEKSIAERRKKSGSQKTKIVESIKDVPGCDLFTKRTVWTATNLKTLVDFELSGTNIDFYLGTNDPLRKLLMAGEIDSFTKNNLYMKFSRGEIVLQNSLSKPNPHNKK